MVQTRHYKSSRAPRCYDTPMPAAATAQLTISPAWRQRLARHGLDSFDALWHAAGDDKLEKASLPPWRGRARIALHEHPPAALFIKTYDHPPLRERLAARAAGFPAPAHREWHWAKELAEAGVAAVEPVALGVDGGRSLLVSAQAAGQSLERWLAQRDPHTGGAGVGGIERRAIGEALARLVRDLHGARLFHRDLYASHIFIDEGGDTGGPRLTLIDLQRIVRARVTSPRWQLKDLAALHYSIPTWAATRADRVRWMKRYLGRLKLRLADRLLMRLVDIKARRIARHSRRRAL